MTQLRGQDRDLYVPVAGTGGRAKINAALAKGPEQPLLSRPPKRMGHSRIGRALEAAPVLG